MRSPSLTHRIPPSDLEPSGATELHTRAEAEAYQHGPHRARPVVARTAASRRLIGHRRTPRPGRVSGSRTDVTPLPELHRG
jgi:hypothetical protein